MAATDGKRKSGRNGAALAAMLVVSACVFALSASSVARIFLPAPPAPAPLADALSDGGARIPREAFETLAFLSSGRHVGDEARFTVPVWDTEARISGKFGWRENPLTGEGSEFHSGLDIAARKGSPVVASRDGRVSASYDDKYTGQTVEVRHADGTTSVYAHMEDRVAAPGEVVSRGETIGHVGYSGRATGPHLHFALRGENGYVDPLPHLWLDAARLALVKE